MKKKTTDNVVQISLFDLFPPKDKNITTKVKRTKSADAESTPVRKVPKCELNIEGCGSKCCCFCKESTVNGGECDACYMVHGRNIDPYTCKWNKSLKSDRHNLN